MIDPVIRLKTPDWREWLFAVANTGTLRQVELSVDLLTDPELKTQLEHYGIRVVHGGDLLPAHIGRYLWETTPVPWEQVLANTTERLHLLDEWGIRATSLDLGMGRIAAETCGSGLEPRVEFLQRLRAEAESLEICLGVDTRYPREYPLSKAWEYAVNLVREISLDYCRLSLDLFAGELAEDFDLAAFVRRVYLTVETVRFHFNPCLGETLDNLRTADWLKTLQAHEFRGQFIFCPEQVPTDECAKVCEQIDRCCRDAT
jgi:hypothetical protein